MKTKRRTLIVLLVFVLAAGAALALLTHANQKAEQAASEAEDGSIPLLDGTPATLESVSIQYGGEMLTLRPSDDGWTLTEDPAYHLDDSACSTIRTALAGMKARRQLEAQPGEDYGFDAPRIVVNVSAAGESTTLTVGAENPVTGDVYVRREGGDAVYTVDAARFRCMEQTKAELFGAFSPAGITVSDIEAVRYTLQSGETIKLQSVSQPTEADSNCATTINRGIAYKLISSYTNCRIIYCPPPIANIVRRDFDNIESFDFLLNMRMPFNFISLGCVILLTRP